MQNICTLLIEQNSFLREGMKSLLAQSDYEVVLEIESAQNINLLENEHEYDLIIYGISGIDEDCVCAIPYLKSKFSGVRIVVFADDMDTHLIKKAFL